MKYEVIGWTHCSDREFPYHEPVTACIELAVRKEIVGHGYLFGGDAHEDYCPILNDGTLVSFSWRGWGGVMARAYGENEPFGYMHYYMNEMIAPDKRKYPGSDVRYERIVPRLTLAEKFSMHLREDMFDAMASGKKKVEFRLFDEKRKRIDIGDYIEFIGPHGGILKRVADLHLEKDFKALFRHLTERHGFTAEDFGCPERTDADAFEGGMSAIYPPETQKEGVLALTLEDALPRHRVCLTAHIEMRSGWPDEDEIDIFDLLPGPDEIDEMEEKLQEIAPFKRCAGGFCLAAEGTDATEAIGSVVGPLLGKEELKALAEKFGLSFSFDVTSLFPSGTPASPIIGERAGEVLSRLGARVHCRAVALQ